MIYFTHFQFSFDFAFLIVCGLYFYRGGLASKALLLQWSCLTPEENLTFSTSWIPQVCLCVVLQQPISSTVQPCPLIFLSGHFVTSHSLIRSRTRWADVYRAWWFMLLFTLIVQYIWKIKKVTSDVHFPERPRKLLWWGHIQHKDLRWGCPFHWCSRRSELPSTFSLPLYRCT